MNENLYDGVRDGITDDWRRPGTWNDALQAVRYGGKVFVFNAADIAVARRDGIDDAIQHQSERTNRERIAALQAENTEGLSRPSRLNFTGTP